MKQLFFFDQMSKLMKRVNEANVALSAAGLAYYTLFSIFPLLLLLVSIGSTLLKGEGITPQILWFIDQAIPGSQALIQDTLPALAEERGAIGLVGLVTLFWSASNVFMVLNANVNVAWPGSRPRNYLRRRLVALGIVGILVLILVVYILFIIQLEFLAWLQVPLSNEEGLLGSAAWDWISSIIAWLLIFGLLFGVYHWIPVSDVPRRSALIAAGAATLILFVINRLFALMFSLIVQRYALVYGSLSSVLVFLINIYFSSFVVLAGAHLSATISKDSVK